MDIDYYLQLAADTAVAKEDKRTFRVGCVCLRSDGTVVKSSNGPTPEPCRHVHAETKAARKLDYGGTAFVVRVRRDGSYANARPCDSCEKILRSRKVKKVYFTTQSGEIESMDLT